MTKPENTPIGLRGQTGCNIFDKIIEAHGSVSDAFENVLETLWSRYSNASGPGQHAILRPEESARQFILEHLLPVINMNHEVECYFLLNAIKHLDQTFPHFQSDEYDPFAPDDDDPEHALFTGGHMSFQFNRRRAIVDCLKYGHVEGTLLEQYLKYPITSNMNNPHLFSIEGSQASRKWARTEEKTAALTEHTP